MRICSIYKCNRKHDTHGFCRIHAFRFKKYGDPTYGKTVTGEPERFLRENLDYELDDCLVWPYSTGKNGYGAINIDTENGRTHTFAHRVMCRMKHGESPTRKHTVAHSCNNRSCVNPKHLRWATMRENESDKLLHGTRPMGEKHPKTTLNNNDVIEIMKDNKSYTNIAKEYGVSKYCIVDIKRGRTWGWLTGVKL